MEILQLIARLVDTTLLRLVSKAVSFAVFDVFSQEYLGELRCYVMDPARLKRLKCITSADHLVRGIEKVTLCLDPFELKRYDEIALAPNNFTMSGGPVSRKLGLFMAQEIARQWYIYNEHNLHCHKKLDQALLVSILWDLKEAQCPNITLDLLQCTERVKDGVNMKCNSMPVKNNTITHTILNAAFCSGCSLSGLKLGSDDFTNPKLFSITNVRSWETLGENLQTFYLAPHGSDLSRRRRPVKHRRSLNVEDWITMTAALLDKAKDLQTLHLAAIWGKPPRRNWPNSLQLTSAIFATNRFSRLRVLSIFRLQCHLPEFMSLLQCCKDSLRSLDLIQVNFTISGLSWLRMFELLLDCSHLERLFFALVYEQGALARRLAYHVDGRKEGLLKATSHSDVVKVLMSHVGYLKKR